MQTDQVVSSISNKESQMVTIMPQKELVKRAVAYIQERLNENPENFNTLLDQAGMRFNLSPKEAEMLKDFFKQSESDH